MTNQKEIYKCEICENIIEVLHSGKGVLVCCNQNMKLMKEQSGGEYAEKHAPVIEKNNEGVVINVGKTDHPMEENHYIEWVEILTDKGISKKFLKPGEKPNVKFPVKKDVKSRMYCNLHGLWVNE
ncbi:desulfoferrodoxin [Nanoarchaeota archaeon]